MKLYILGKTGLIGHAIAESINNKFCVMAGLEMTDIPEEADYIIHAAGYAQPLKFLADEIATISVNTTKLIELLGKMKSGAKALYMSSSEVYNGLPVPQNESQIGTTDPTHPRACYIEGKRCGEAICMAYRRLGKDVKIARVSLVYGKTRSGDTRAMSHFIEQSKTGTIQLMDKGEVKRTYLFIDDAVKIFWDILIDGKEPIYNVGGVSKTTIAELAETIAKLTGAKVLYGNKGLEGAPTDVELDISKVIQEFGTREFTPLEKGLKSILDDTI